MLVLRVRVRFRACACRVLLLVLFSFSLAFMLAFLNLRRGSKAQCGGVRVGGASCVGGAVSKAWCRRRGVECLLVRERVRVDRQRERVVLDNKVEQLGVVLGLSW